MADNDNRLRLQSKIDYNLSGFNDYFLHKWVYAISYIESFTVVLKPFYIYEGRKFLVMVVEYAM